eukprot:6699209-Prymnesium_polylepis.1
MCIRDSAYTGTRKRLLVVGDGGRSRSSKRSTCTSSVALRFGTPCPTSPARSLRAPTAPPLAPVIQPAYTLPSTLDRR